MEKERFDYDGWIQKGKVRISELQSGKTFTLTSLFSTEWDEIPKNYRKSFGAKFSRNFVYHFDCFYDIIVMRNAK